MSEILLPVVREIETQLGKVALTHENAVLLRYQDPRDNAVEYTDFKTNEMQSLKIFDEDFQTLLDDGFGWEYVPEQNEELITVRLKKSKEYLDIEQAHSRVRTFSNAYYNHVETQRGNRIVALLIPGKMLSEMFRKEYPWKHMPFVDNDSKAWRESL